ncbi:hypothetical protein SAMN05421783_1039 [Thiocapsa roseopersicina]|uniref:Uncharacterized protein n=1 Tax=Thiocapsa roseopersicina TaxID=1058 RepID=A0A1H2SJR9_THIRO|nr:hypothetical protein SAMN05421783_1039 [Thiocapsa roseopersicina]
MAVSDIFPDDMQGHTPLLLGCHTELPKSRGPNPNG